MRLLPLCRRVWPAVVIGMIVLIPAHGYQTAAQMPDNCGVVDTIGYPVTNIRQGGDDFGIYRAKFGGLHTAVDLAFYDYGFPVRAIARGRVTYADVAGWDTEKGVVIVEHVFPSGEVYYSLYGHMESFGDYFFPSVGQCVEAGTILGAVGDPSLSAPHLHFEVRTFGPYDGGPGYWDTNPLEAGWLHPLDFIRLWQIRLQDAIYVSHVTAPDVPSTPPLVMADGVLVLAAGSRLEGIGPDGSLRWRMELSSTISGITLLDDGRILVRTADNSIQILRDGRYEGVWTPTQALAGAPLLLAGAVAFFTEDNALAGYTPTGSLLWITPPLGDRLGDVAAGLDRLAVGTRPRLAEITPAWHVVGPGGQLLYQVSPANPPLAVADPTGDYYLLDGATLYHIARGEDGAFTPAVLASLPVTPGQSTALLADQLGGVYVFTALDEATLSAYDAAGEPRWQTALPGMHRQPPRLAAGDGCLIYAGAVDGTLYALSAADGTIRGQVELYTGGYHGQPNARLLDVFADADGRELVRFGAGYLSVITVDGYALAGLESGVCPDAASQPATP